MKKLTLILVAVVLIGTGAWLYSNKKATPVNSGNQTAQSDAAGNAAPAKNTADGAKEFTIIGKNFSFSPSTIMVNKGDLVRVTFKDEGGFHDLVIDGINAKTNRIQSGNQDIVEFTADKTGTFEYYCSVGNHRDEGMKGTLIVK